MKIETKEAFAEFISAVEMLIAASAGKIEKPALQKMFASCQKLKDAIEEEWEG